MTRVAILPVPEPTDGVAYLATALGRESHGKTVGQALDALTAQLPEEELGTFVVVQNLRADRFFGAEQQQRLADLMSLWRSTRDEGGELREEQQRELDALIEKELQATTRRTSALLDALSR